MEFRKESEHENYGVGHPGYSYEGWLFAGDTVVAQFGNGTAGLHSTGFASPSAADEFRAMPDGPVDGSAAKRLLRPATATVVIAAEMLGVPVEMDWRFQP